jgi:hypothetical protein
MTFLAAGAVFWLVMIFMFGLAIAAIVALIRLK